MAMSELPNDITLIDTFHLGRPHVIGAHLLIGDAPLLIDPGPTSTLAAVEAGMHAAGVSIADLRAVLLTHIHLDHAGATGELLRRNPQIAVYVHQRGARHMVNPEKLIASASRLYGAMMETLWGAFLPVPAEQITALSGGGTLHIGGRSFAVQDAPGHASHHVIYLEQASGAAFIGDNGGIKVPGMPFATPATPPPDIDIAAWGRTLDALEAADPQVLMLTHFGPSFDPQTHIADYRARLGHWAEFVRAGLASGGTDEEQVARLKALAVDSLGDGISLADKESFLQAAPLDQCWQGLARYWRKQAELAGS